MNMHFGNCPRCGEEINSERVLGSTVVCECGWTKSARHDVNDRKNMDKTCASIVLIGGILIAAFLQAVNWDQHFFSIIPLKTKQVLGSASIQDLEKIAAICIDRKKHECTERAYVQIARKQPTNLANLNRLGQLQYKRERYSHAVDTMTLYFSQKGAELDAAYTYAQALTKLKKYDQAERYYKFALNQRQSVLQVTVIRNYVQMLVEANRLQKARETILIYRKQSSNANLFMDKELAAIKARLGEVKTASAGV
ncbi:MAG: tetratricopeptide repeat protein [Bdellovibrionales bacterium]